MNVLKTVEAVKGPEERGVERAADLVWGEAGGEHGDEAHEQGGPDEEEEKDDHGGRMCLVELGSMCDC